MPLHHTETADLPIEGCEPCPKAMMRFEYGPEDPSIMALAEMILAQGQLQRGRAVPKAGGDGRKWEVYIGTRRYFAIKSLAGKPGAPAVYRAEIDYGLTEDEVITRALMENEEGQGERKPLSVEEELAYYRLLLQDKSEDEVISICERAGKDNTTMTRSIRIARTLGSDKLRKLYEVEKKSGFRFALAHTEEFTKLPDDRTMFQVAAVTADKKFDPGAVKPEAAKELVKSVAWFSEVFPEYATEAPDSAGATADKKKGKRGTSKAAEPSLDFLQCPHCGAHNPFKHKVDVTFTFLTGLRSDGIVRKKSVEPLGLFITEVECINPECSGRRKGRKKKGEASARFWVIVHFKEEDAKDGQGKARRVTLVQPYDSEAAASAVLSILKGEAITGAMRFDSKRERYMVLDGKERLLEMDEHYKLREAEDPGRKD
ncbi:MAG: hypothetical protein JRN11_07230 [Nitrososphaerota archaeon]|nr:hypothetical protein [Nitrososphaerota archaeon]MDG7013247.1 hypothetical protein [Nitrososphaerota archaeon]MDG7026522.1 hypothetical protein [Nitrososphaerota archaeon]